MKRQRAIVCTRLAVGLLAVLLLAAVPSVSQRSELLRLIDAGVNGASASGGYVAEHGGFYYYANPEDGNCLYRVDAALNNPEKLSDHENRSPYIQLSAAGNRVFYLRSSAAGTDAVRKRICVYDTDSGTETVVFDKDVISYIVLDDWILCETVSPAQTYRVRVDGSDAEKVGNEYPNAFAVSKWGLAEDALISATHEGIQKYDLTSGQATGFQGYSADFAVDGKDIYSINHQHRRALELYHTETMSYADRTTIVSRNVDSFTLYGGTLVYATENGLMWIKETEGRGKAFLGFGSNPMICGRFLFYISRGDGIRYLGRNSEGTL